MLTKSVNDLLTKLGADTVYHNAREYYIKTNHSNIYQDIMTKTLFLGKANFTERLYCYVNNITERPKCAVCANKVVWNRSAGKGYKTYCSSSCSMIAMPSILGVENTSQLQSVKNKKKLKSIEKYGVDNPAQAVSVRKSISTGIRAHWKKVYANKDFTTEGLTREQYGRRCHQYAETQYIRYKDIIDPTNKRSKDWHVDHIYSVTDGFLNDVPVNVLSDISNLRLISANENYKKHKKSEKSLAKLYEDYELVSCL